MCSAEMMLAAQDRHDENRASTSIQLAHLTKSRQNMALKTTDTTEKAPTMEESVGQKKICH
ncbi:hypothetical protein T05_3134 [Trichinella murrelli]|uniref:Uncharacterized protein n=1 Tax=Trichinella murrelli TaxID=144512 RepID=A0A0V0SXW9_9BILA|nr:hypothetical protein T05_3134 [Trichinella murrelli]